MTTPPALQMKDVNKMEESNTPDPGEVKKPSPDSRTDQAQTEQSAGKENKIYILESDYIKSKQEDAVTPMRAGPDVDSVPDIPGPDLSSVPDKPGPDVGPVPDKPGPAVVSVPDKDDEDNSLKIDENAKVSKEVVKRKKIAGFIVDKTLRIRSFVRRRPIPFKRLSELDVQCGTKSFMVQINKDLDEVVYSGSNDLVKCFLSSAGLKISDVNNVLVAGKYQARPRGTAHCWEHDYNPAPASDNDDEDFYDTVKTGKKKKRKPKPRLLPRNLVISSTLRVKVNDLRSSNLEKTLFSLK